ncbi:hypothetical protein CBM2609_A10059 [Cupriavidus taiwanensis]|nr:hypothetical protein CBM2604_A10058 [Cupriavidus taiwanensis]SOZ20273.1 hypothetical protein CBM2609_A10059 [Cupriavidus taiwanensis]SOZ41073.1 hypothetical protein CBM2610_A10083 [Cupriavidus taiwanensis]
MRAMYGRPRPLSNHARGPPYPPLHGVALLLLVVGDNVADDAAHGRTAQRTQRAAVGQDGAAHRAGTRADGGVTLFRGHVRATGKGRDRHADQGRLGQSLQGFHCWLRCDDLCMPDRSGGPGDTLVRVSRYAIGSALYEVLRQ